MTQVMLMVILFNHVVYQPFRFDRQQAITCDMNDDYTAEQNATNGGLMDKFVKYAFPRHYTDQDGFKQVMGHYDGNTVTALQNYAQHFAMSDNYFDTTSGPSTPGALNPVSVIELFGQELLVQYMSV